MNNEELIQKCIDGDVKAFEILIGEHQKKIYNMTLRYFDREEAFDVTQEVLIKIFKGLKSFKSSSTLSTWIYRITVNTCMDYLRKNKKDNVVIMENNEVHDRMDYADYSHSPELKLEKKELIHAIKESISLLSLDSKNVIVLRDINGLSYEEVSEVLGVPVGTVKSRLYRARLELRGYLVKREVRV